jgi:hypothetical protein
MHRLTNPEVAALITELNLLTRLSGFDPHVVGSMPLAVHTAGSDLDVCCSAGASLERFKTRLDRQFSGFPDYHSRQNKHCGEPSVIAFFSCKGVPVEIYGRARPVRTHESYVHFRVEHTLLALGGERLRQAVVAAKQGGLNTEAAFAKCLKLKGDGFSQILSLASVSPDRLKTLVLAAGFPCRRPANA